MPEPTTTAASDDLAVAQAQEADELGWWSCCDHCGCGTPDGVWPIRDGHDDTCAQGCNDT